MVNRNRRATTVERDDHALFVKDGVPVKFCFHRSVTQGRGQITRDVERHGGKIVPDERRANVLLVDEQEDIALLRRQYYSSTELYRLSLYVEPRGFVRACIRSGSYCHVGPVKKGMPGRVGSVRGRVPFTEEDRDNLAYYLATRCPTQDGRMGNNAYKDLVRLGETDDPSWAWARRHTFHSWREHYKMNPAMMNARIDRHLERLKDVGHHMGHDLRRHGHRNPRLEEEEDEEDEEEEDEQWQGIERQGRERRGQARQVVAAAGRARTRNYRVHQEQDLLTFDEEEGVIHEEEVAIQDPQRVKRHRVRAQQQREVQETHAKRARISKTSLNEKRTSGVEAGHGESSAARERDSDNSEESGLEGSDLFGDRTYGDESGFEFDNSQEIDFPMPFSPRASPVPEQDGLSTQATLVTSPLAVQKEIPTPGPTLATVIEPQIPRARSRSVDRQLVPVPESQLARPQEDQRGRGKGKAKEQALVSIEEDVQVEDELKEAHAEEDVEPVVVTGGLSTRETFQDEMAVAGLLDASIGSGVDEEDEGREASVGVHDEDDGDSDGDEDIVPDLPRFQEVDIESEPTDSDDAETHGSLVRGAVREGSAVGGDAESDQGQDRSQGQDEDSDDADADRIERMANGSLHTVPAPTPPQPRVTRSQIQTQTHPQISPRRTRSGKTGFPSPGTKARAVVDLFQEEERKIPYAPPVGSRAAKATRGRRKRD